MTTAAQPDLGNIWLLGVLVSAPIFSAAVWWLVGVEDLPRFLLNGITALGFALLWPLVVVSAVLAAVGVALGAAVAGMAELVRRVLR